jgi:two-component system, NtrC family, response regulator AtoC
VHERLLIIEDDGLLRDVLAARFGFEGLEARTAPTLAAARGVLDAFSADVVLADLKLPDGESLVLLAERAAEPADSHAPVWIVMTAHATVDKAVAALKLGAVDFLEKPFSLDRAVATVRKALEMTVLRREVQALREQSSVAGTTIIGQGPAMRAVFDMLERLGQAGATTVLIEGESGTGKGAIAQALHRVSARAKGPFLNVTCSALPDTLMESELFGHEKGAFTDARSTKRGLVELAHGGTLFLDEIAELSSAVQAKLLRFIEDKTFRRLGGTQDLTVDARIVAATNRSLEDEVAAGRFRRDLFYRLRVVPIALPALRERREDILPLARHFLERFTRELGRRVQRLSAEAGALLTAYDWPGNVRELKNVMERAVLLCDGPEIRGRDLPAEVRDPAPAAAGRGAAPPGRTLEDVEHGLLEDALNRTSGNQSRAAALLGISRHQLRTRMTRYGMLPPARDAGDTP